MPPSWLRALLLDGVLVVGWLASIGMVVVHEAGGLWGGSRPMATLGATLEAKEQWFLLSYQGHPIGFSRTTLTPEERDGAPGVGIADAGRLSFTLLGTPQRLDVNARAFIDADWRLQVFTASIQSPTHQLTWSGRRVGEDLVVTVTTPASSVTKRLRDPTGNAFINGLSSWAAFHRLRVGDSGRGWVLNPMALNPEVVHFHVRSRDILDGNDVLVVETDVGGMTATSWVTPEGDVLKETSPLGWELRQASREEAFQFMARVSPALDLLSALSVPIDRPLDHPDRIARVTLLVEGLEESQLGVERPWQRVLPPSRLADYHRTTPEEPWTLLELTRPSLPTAGPEIPAAIERYRKPSLFVQSDDPRIIAKAREMIGDPAVGGARSAGGGRTEPWDRAAALTHGVFALLAKRLTIGLPSALDILATPEGDCHEHTVFFTALARSAGLPTRMVAGLVYQQGQLYYHAWPEVWLGEWIPTDPTLDQPVADATHLGLIEAENENLIALGPFIGKLRVQVLEVMEEPAPHE